jgi:hypothetical protein
MSSDRPWDSAYAARRHPIWKREPAEGVALLEIDAATSIGPGIGYLCFAAE